MVFGKDKANGCVRHYIFADGEHENFESQLIEYFFYLFVFFLSGESSDLFLVAYGYSMRTVKLQ